ncbi:MAG: ABC transporter permease [Betaproteobacteria bacterium RIFCSPLOWO2_12_FULL_62_13]|nr:MAG: ABC transporter permease [Betaproteobacteria bacterium RIFCSPLOWO2_12_FULL_62_13]
MPDHVLVQRPEFVREVETSAFGVVEKPLTVWEKIYNNGAIRKGVLLLLLAAAWQIYATALNNPLLFPKFSDTFGAFYDGIVNGVLLGRAWFSITVLLQGYAAGLALAALLTAFAITSRVGNDFLETLTSMFNPLPAIALLPLALIWFGLGNASLVFVLVHSVLWAVALNTHSGFMSVSQTMRMVGRNYGLSGPRYVVKILIPAAFPSILTGMKIGWAFAWRTLIAAELVFGVSSGSGGLGWFIYENKNQLEIANVFAGLFSVIIIGLLVENIIFRNVELRTVRKWGVQS